MREKIKLVLDAVAMVAHTALGLFLLVLACLVAVMRLFHGLLWPGILFPLALIFVGVIWIGSVINRKKRRAEVAKTQPPRERQEMGERAHSEFMAAISQKIADKQAAEKRSSASPP